MNLAIFYLSNDLEKYNDFLKNNIIIKDKFFEDGRALVFFKTKNELGQDYMDQIEQIDRMVTTAEKDIFLTETNMRITAGELADIEKKLAEEKDAKEIKLLEESKKNFERQTKMDKFTIEQKQREIACLKEIHQEILNKQ